MMLSRNDTVRKYNVYSHGNNIHITEMGFSERVRMNPASVNRVFINPGFIEQYKLQRGYKWKRIQRKTSDDGEVIKSNMPALADSRVSATCKGCAQTTPQRNVTQSCCTRLMRRSSEPSQTPLPIPTVLLIYRFGNLLRRQKTAHILPTIARRATNLYD